MSAKKLSVSFLDSKKSGDSEEFENTASGFKKIVSWIKNEKTIIEEVQDAVKDWDSIANKYKQGLRQ